MISNSFFSEDDDFGCGFGDGQVTDTAGALGDENCKE